MRLWIHSKRPLAYARGSVMALAILVGLHAQPVSPLEREGSYWVETISGSLASAETSQLRVDVRASVSVHGEGGNQLVYRLRRRVEARTEAEARRLLATCEFRARRLGPVVHLEVSEPPRSRVLMELEVRVPRALGQAIVESRVGSLDLTGLNADVQAFTGGGPIQADQLSGSLIARTGGGAISIGSVGGSVRAFSGGGPIRVKNCGGEATLETGGGEIVVEQAGSAVSAVTGAGNIEVGRAGGLVVARTHGGIIRVSQAEGQVNAENAGGLIQVDSANGVRCESAGGGIKLRGISGQMRVAAAVGSILAELLSNRVLSDSYLSTHRGDIILLIPSNLAVTVEAMNESRGRAGIVSEFREIRVRGSESDPRIVATGALNGGGPLLRVSATDGTIYLRRQK